MKRAHYVRSAQAARSATRTGSGVRAQNASIGTIHAASRMTLIAVQNGGFARARGPCDPGQVPGLADGGPWAAGHRDSVKELPVGPLSSSVKRGQLS